MKPGATTSPLASIVCFPCRVAVLMAAIFPVRIRTLRTTSGPDSGSITRPSLTTKSKPDSWANTSRLEPKRKQRDRANNDADTNTHVFAGGRVLTVSSLSGGKFLSVQAESQRNSEAEDGFAGKAVPNVAFPYEPQNKGLPNRAIRK